MDEPQDPQNDCYGLGFGYHIIVFILIWLDLGAFGRFYRYVFVEELLYIPISSSSVSWGSLETMDTEDPVVKGKCTVSIGSCLQLFSNKMNQSFLEMGMILKLVRKYTG